MVSLRGLNGPQGSLTYGDKFVAVITSDKIMLCSWACFFHYSVNHSMFSLWTTCLSHLHIWFWLQNSDTPPTTTTTQPPPPAAYLYWLISSLSVSMMFQSFTEGELQHVVGKLLERKRRRSRRVDEKQARRTKRARGFKSCSIKELQLTVSELGLGYDSDETVVLRYCSGRCTSQRDNYDLTMAHIILKGRVQGKVSNKPCCRPTAFEKDFSFLDNNSRYHTVQNVSAKNCGCVWPKEMDSRLSLAALSLCWNIGTLMLVKDNLWNINSRKAGRDGNILQAALQQTCSLLSILATESHGQQVLQSCGFQVKRQRKGLFIPKKFILYFYLCSNTVSCGVTTM